VFPDNAKTGSIIQNGKHFLIISLILGIVCSGFLSLLIPTSNRPPTINIEMKEIKKGPKVIKVMPSPYKVTQARLIAFVKRMKIPGIIFGGYLFATLLTYWLAF